MSLAQKLCNKVLYLDHGQPVFFGAMSDYRHWYDVERRIPHAAAAQ
jgi:hypothetical protein